MVGGVNLLNGARNRVMPKPNVSFNRTPSPQLRALLKPGHFLSPILDLRFQDTKVSCLGLDVHFRRDDVIHIYCGLTRVVALKRMRRDGVLKLYADKFYMDEPGRDTFFRKWHSDELTFVRELHNYIQTVEVNPRHRTKEGSIQQKWSHVSDMWTPFDREARLEYRSEEYRKRARKFEGVEGAFCQLTRNWEDKRKRGVRWAKPTKTGIKVDQLAIDSKGHLVLIELKDAESGTPSEIYYSPFQLFDPPPWNWSTLRLWKEEDRRWQGSVTSLRRS